MPAQGPIFVFVQVYPPAGVIFAGIGVLLSVSIFLIPSFRRPEHQHSKATKAVSSSQDAFVDVFERIENFFRRLETYVQVPPTPGMTDMIIKIMIEVLSILAIATKEFHQENPKTLIRVSQRLFNLANEIYLA